MGGAAAGGLWFPVYSLPLDTRTHFTSLPKEWEERGGKDSEKGQRKQPLWPNYVKMEVERTSRRQKTKWVSTKVWQNFNEPQTWGGGGSGEKRVSVAQSSGLKKKKTAKYMSAQIGLCLCVHLLARMWHCVTSYSFLHSRLSVKQSVLISLTLNGESTTFQHPWA